MNRFKSVNPKELDGNVFRNIGDDWLLICAYDEENKRENAMTASWGGMGILWNKAVCFLFVRPQRHTYKLIENTDKFAVCFLPEEYRAALRVCGSKSGRDCDKLKETGLEQILIDDVYAIGESEKIFVLKKIYTDNIEKSGFVDETLLKNYPNDDYHRVYVCEIESAYVR